MIFRQKHEFAVCYGMQRITLLSCCHLRGPLATKQNQKNWIASGIPRSTRGRNDGMKKCETREKATK
ncbi:MAG: hypothetical protein A2103_04040 [Gammaproteobacteria bacterium GWF2_41_13]|nr:MAG: hypothetical protein A2103_04040 [Gammaproteobacteria bacterium GWF2_41_13]